MTTTEAPYVTPEFVAAEKRLLAALTAWRDSHLPPDRPAMTHEEAQIGRVGQHYVAARKRMEPGCNPPPEASK